MKVLRKIRLGSLLGLTAVWMLLWGRPSWGTFFLGLFVAATVLAVFPMPRAASRIRIRPLALLWLVGNFLRELTIASVHVAWLAVRPAPLRPGRIAVVHLHDDDDFRRTVVAELTSLVPGSVVMDLDPVRSELLVHFIDHTDDERLAREVAHIHRREREVARAFGAPAPEGCGGAHDTWTREVQ
ncbi:Na+/H+ antiporter subunit E [Enemella evansiae]|uniref:Na+/H+ antiporter subunit E n=1 Tax=Enemella evansiae TaxID=2016499 RepID=UPI00105FDD37|nr:Na+/H+ antiporter subunit E [Enemella evansiae]TDO86400.1 multisubunit sodium/proton antiporter MrpE subunit [Enemella evansiae]